MPARPGAPAVTPPCIPKLPSAFASRAPDILGSLNTPLVEVNPIVALPVSEALAAP